MARLRFPPEEERRLAQELSRIVTYFDRVRQVDVSETLPSTAAPTSYSTAVPDRAGEPMPRETFLANAPDALDGFLAVPRVKGEDDG